MKNLLSIILLLTTITTYSQSIIFNQGFEARGTTTTLDNWGFIGGVRTTETSKGGSYSLKIGSPNISQVTFNTVDISQYTNSILQISHSVLQGSFGEAGLDSLEGVTFQVSLDGGNWVTISKISGLNNYHYTFNDSIAGASSTSSSCRLFKTPNPLNYQIPQNTNTISVRIMTIKSSNCRGFNYNANNGISNHFDRLDEAVFIDNVRILGESTTFPVEMGQFNSENDGNEIKLNWLTYSETNTDMFVIERSGNGVEFEELGIVYANNLGDIKSHYEFIDNNPLIGDNYYRLKIIDLDLSFEYSKVIYDLIEKPLKISVYPNPIIMGESLNIIVDEEIDELFITDLNGYIISKNKHIPNNIPPGCYILTTIIKGKILTNKIMVK